MSHAVEELLTLRDWLRWAVSRFQKAGLFFGHGCDNPWDEAVWLLLHALHLPPHLPSEQFTIYLDARLTRPEREAALKLLEERIEKRIPAAYLTHEAWLGEFRFYVDERVIVPRSYFAELFEDGLQPWIDDADRILSALDLCTGSGCLAILMAHAFPNADVDAADISEDALAVARRNVADYGLEECVELIRSDVFAALEGRRYDLIVSNPPYVTTAAMSTIPTEYKREPELALVAGDDGLDLVRRILATARQHLNDDGLLLVEVGHNADLVEHAWPDVPFTWIDAPSGESKIFLLSADELETYF
ncbi:MAG: 50S ribosomal protein L3 N(5)-glutamine methyltransferase [Rhodocyclaceae bacterium]|nr:50S ribosomal protein L3 N(5)-glutamine methyltransferase [Rhodocyclaceae bacterium]